jgi:hypothetical protein
MQFYPASFLDLITWSGKTILEHQTLFMTHFNVTFFYMDQILVIQYKSPCGVGVQGFN